MGKRKKAKTIAVRDPERAAMLRRYVMHALAVGVLLGLLGVSFVAIRRYVDREVIVQTRPPRVALKNRPVWMSDALAIQIINSIKPTSVHSTFDKQLLADTVALLQHNPWVKQVRQVRRAYAQSPGDTLEVDCEYRAPIALVHWNLYYWLVDGEGVKLPEQFTEQELPGIMMGRERWLNMRVIKGVRQPPVESGKKWPGEDLAAGLDLAKILYGRNYADEITAIDVSNFGGRVKPTESQLVLVTKYSTQIRWGRPINPGEKDFFVEIPVAQKLKYLEEVYTRYHRVDGGMPWIDIRFDKVTYPSGEATVR